MDVRRVSARPSRRAGQAYISCVTHPRLPSIRRCDARCARIVSFGRRIRRSPHGRRTPSDTVYEAPERASWTWIGGRMYPASSTPQPCALCPLPAIRHLGPDHRREWVILEHRPSPSRGHRALFYALSCLLFWSAAPPRTTRNRRKGWKDCPRKYLRIRRSRRRAPPEAQMHGWNG